MSVIFLAMRKIVNLMVCLCVSLWAFAQDVDSVKHLEFKGIPIDGSLNEFVSKLEAKGFTKTETMGTIAQLKGEFAGENVNVYVVGSEKTKTVWKVAVFFPEKSSWRSLKRDYFDYKELFTKKYGKPKNDFEFFSDPYYEGDGYELQALRLDKCSYCSFYNTREGSIMLEIDSSKCISVGYEDATNVKIKSREEEENVMDDI